MIRLLIADDHPVVREGLKRLITECPDMRVVGEAADGDAVLEQSKTAGADVLLLDISMPGPGLLDIMRQLRMERPDLRVLVLSMHPEDDYAVRALRAGAAGYLTKNRSPEELAAAIRRVYRGEKYVSAALAERLAWELEPAAAGERPHAVLSDREYRVLCKLGTGRSSKQIAAEVALSPKTISTYRKRILHKLKLKTNAELIRYVIEHGLID